MNQAMPLKSMCGNKRICFAVSTSSVFQSGFTLRCLGGVSDQRKVSQAPVKELNSCEDKRIYFAVTTNSVFQGGCEMRCLGRVSSQRKICRTPVNVLTSVVLFDELLRSVSHKFPLTFANIVIFVV